VRAVQLLTERLTLPAQHGPEIRQLTGSRAPDGSQPARQARLGQVLEEVSAARTAGLLAELAEHGEPGGLAVSGVAGTLGALAQDRVRTLLVVDDPADRRTAWFGAEPTQVSPDPPADLGNLPAELANPREELAGVPVLPGRLPDVAVRAALLTGADVRVVPPDTPGQPAEGLGALCRW